MTEFRLAITLSHVINKPGRNNLKYVTSIKYQGEKNKPNKVRVRFIFDYNEQSSQSHQTTLLKIP
jgi:hypothetical protein